MNTTLCSVRGPQVKNLSTIPDLIKHTGIQQQLHHLRWANSTGTQVFWCITEDNCEQHSEIHSTPMLMPLACCKARTLSTLLSKVLDRGHISSSLEAISSTRPPPCIPNAISQHLEASPWPPAASTFLPQAAGAKDLTRLTSANGEVVDSFFAGWCLTVWCQLLRVPNGSLHYWDKHQPFRWCLRAADRQRKHWVCFQLLSKLIRLASSFTTKI